MSALHWAAEHGDVETCRRLLTQGAVVDTKDEETDYTPLYVAADNGHVHVCRLLLEKGASVATANRFGWTALETAARNGHLEVCRLLLEKGALVATVDAFGWSALQTAVQYGHLDVCRLLLRYGASVATADEDGRTPLHTAVDHGDLEFCRLLLSYGASVATAMKNGWTPLHLAVDNGNLQVCRLLLDNGASVEAATEFGWTPLHIAACKGHLEVCFLLLRNGASVATAIEAGKTPLHSAAQYGHLRICRLLLENGASVATADVYGRTPLHTAARYGQLEVCHLLLENRASVATTDGNAKTPLHAAARKGLLEVCRLLLENGASVLMTDSHGETPLHKASRGSNFETCRLLIEWGASACAVNDQGCLPEQVTSDANVFHLLRQTAAKTKAFIAGQLPSNSASSSAEEESSDSFEIFLQGVTQGDHMAVSQLSEKYVHSHASSGQTALHVAAANGQLIAVKTLVFLGANVDERDHKGGSPLHLAANGGFLDVVEFLLVHGAQLDGIDDDGFAPMHLAALYGKTDVVSTLVTQGGDLTLTTRGGSTVFHCAATRNDHDELLQTLLGGHNDDSQTQLLEQPNHDGMTVLHVAALCGSSKLLPLLMEYSKSIDSTIDAMDNRKRSALHYAVSALLVNCQAEDFTVGDLKVPKQTRDEAEYIDVARQLVQAGARIDLRDEDGETALDVAIRDRREAMVCVLLNVGAQVESSSHSRETTGTVAGTNKLWWILDFNGSNQQFREQCIGLLIIDHETVSAVDVTSLVPLITSVYELGAFLSLAEMLDARHVDPTAALTSAFQHITDEFMVLNDDESMFFKQVLNWCCQRKWLSKSDQLWWAQRAERQIEITDLPFELALDVQETHMHLDAPDDSIQRVVNGMHQLHSMVMKNRAVIKTIEASMPLLQSQVNAGKTLVKQLLADRKDLTSVVQRQQHRIAQSELNLQDVTLSLCDSRKWSLRPLKKANQNAAAMRMMIGVVTSLYGFLLTPLVREALHTSVDVANPQEIVSRVVDHKDVVSFLTEDTREESLNPAVRSVLAKESITPDEFTTAIRVGIMLQHPELLDEISQRSRAILLEVSDPEEINQIQSDLAAIKSELSNALRLLQVFDATKATACDLPSYERGMSCTARSSTLVRLTVNNQGIDSNQHVQPDHPTDDKITIHSVEYLLQNSVLPGRHKVRKGLQLGSFGKWFMIKIYDQTMHSHGMNEAKKIRDLTAFAGSNEFIVPCVDFDIGTTYKGHPCSALVMEMGKQSLKQVAETCKPCDLVAQVVPTMKKVAECLHFLHSTARVVHGDVKLENVVNFGDILPDYKLIDFENCRQVGEPMPMDITPEYCPPELATRIVGHHPYPLEASNSFDVWCFGVLWMKYLMRGTILEEFKAEIAWDLLPQEAILDRIAEPEFTFESTLKHLKISKPMKDLIRSCTARTAANRPSFEHILKHPVLCGVNTTVWNEIMQQRQRSETKSSESHAPASA